MQVVESNSVEHSSTKTKIINIFKNCLNILRDNEGLTGEKALRNLSYLFILKLIEPHLGNEIDIDNYEFNLSDYNEGIVETTKEDLLYLSRFSNLAEESEDNLLHNIKCLWDIILSSHPSTKKIFLKGRGFDIKYSHTFRVLLTKLKSIDLSSAELDILGSAYEEVIKDVMTGKVLGQFFTQPSVKRLMVDIVNPQIHTDGKIETCGDPTMGTGGFLITYLSYILKQAREKGITPDWEFIKTVGLYGKELEPDTFQLAVSNMLISSGHLFDQLDCGDSIRVPITRKFDNILANPPFGIKGLKYDSFTSPLKNEYVPIKSDNAVTLFIQVIIYMLKINGKCAVVLPDGQDLFNTKNEMLINVRKYLMKTCDLQEVIYLPSGIFENTSIKTCIFYFIKKKEGNEVLETKIKVSRTNKETGREYNFSEEHQTRTVKFYCSDVFDKGKDTERIEKKLIIEVPIERIKANKYALKYSDYISNNSVLELYSGGIILKTLGEVCILKNGSNITKDKLIDGVFPVVGGGKSPLGYHNEYNVEANTILISKDGAYAGYVSKYDKKVFVSNHGIFITDINTDLIEKNYIYYYLKIMIQDKIYSLQTGSAQPGINKENIAKLNIAIPPLQKQQEIVEYLDFIYEKTIKSSEEKIADLRKENKYLLNNQRSNGQNTLKFLGEVCVFQNGTRIVKNQVPTGEYPVLGGGGFTSFFTNTYTREGKTCKISREGMSLHNCVMILNEKYFLNSQALTINSNTEILKNEYLWYFLDNNKELVFNCGRGSAQKAIDMTQFENIEISIPSIEIQEEIISECEENDKLIKNLELKTDRIKQRAKLHLESILRNNV